jgi:hypothetical protein
MASSKTVTVGRVEALEGRVTGVEGALEGRVEEVAALKERVAALEERIAEMAAATTPVKKEKKERAAPKKPKKEKEVAAPLPEATEGAPDASAYRISAEEIQEGVCVARVLYSGGRGCDRRWSPAIYQEFQCGAPLEEGTEGEEDLCAKCAAHLAAYADGAVAWKKHWFGRLTEEPLDWIPMLGTEWAETRLASGKLKWRGEGGDSASEASSASSASVGGAKPGRKPSAKSEEEKAAEKAAKEAEREAKKAAKEAEKEAEKQRKAEEKAAEKAKKDAEKAEAAAAKKAAKSAPAAKKVENPAPAAASTEPAVTAITLKMIDSELYALVGEDVYEYDTIEETRGALVGRMEGETFVPKTAE